LQHTLQQTATHTVHAMKKLNFKSQDTKTAKRCKTHFRTLQQKLHQTMQHTLPYVLHHTLQRTLQHTLRS